jgi:tRNA(Arg) A34 adenosine deaminase TadA
VTLPDEREDLQVQRDATFLDIAARLAWEAKLHGYKSFGALIVDADGNQVGLGIGHHPPDNHAETEAIRIALMHRRKLTGCVLYVTAEPCDGCRAIARWVGLARICWPIT